MASTLPRYQAGRSPPGLVEFAPAWASARDAGARPPPGPAAGHFFRGDKAEGGQRSYRPAAAPMSFGEYDGVSGCCAPNSRTLAPLLLALAVPFEVLAAYATRNSIGLRTRCCPTSPMRASRRRTSCWRWRPARALLDDSHRGGRGLPTVAISASTRAPGRCRGWAGAG